MNDTSPLSEPPPVPPMPPAPPGKDRKPQGSIAAGIGMAWAIVVACGFLLILLIDWLEVSSRFFLAELLAPIVLVCLVAAVFYIKNKPRTGHGLLLGLGSIFAVALLLVAACFGLLSTIDFSGTL